MNIKEIRKNAPSGATHYDIEDGYVFYWALTDKGFSFYNAWFNVWYLENTHDKELKPLYGHEMNIEEIRKNKPDGATHHWTNQWGTAYYCYCGQIKRWLHYDKHHDHWTCQKMDSFMDNIKPL